MSAGANANIGAELKRVVFDAYSELDSGNNMYEDISDYLSTFNVPDAPNNTGYKLEDRSVEGSVEIALLGAPRMTKGKLISDFQLTLIMDPDTEDRDDIYLQLQKQGEDYMLYASRDVGARKKWHKIYETEKSRPNKAWNRRRHAVELFARPPPSRRARRTRRGRRSTRRTRRNLK